MIISVYYAPNKTAQSVFICTPDFTEYFYYYVK